MGRKQNPLKIASDRSLVGLFSVLEVREYLNSDDIVKVFTNIGVSQRLDALYVRSVFDRFSKDDGQLDQDTYNKKKYYVAVSNKENCDLPATRVFDNNFVINHNDETKEHIENINLYLKSLPDPV